MSDHPVQESTPADQTQSLKQTSNRPGTPPEPRLEKPQAFYKRPLLRRGGTPVRDLSSLTSSLERTREMPPEWLRTAGFRSFDLPRDSTKITRTNKPRQSSYSQPPTPTSLRSRLYHRFQHMHVRMWRSTDISSTSTATPPPLEGNESPKFQDGKERRRQAHDSEGHEVSKTPSPLSTPGQGGASPLALAGVMVATSELDRLSGSARLDADPKNVEDNKE